MNTLITAITTDYLLGYASNLSKALVLGFGFSTLGLPVSLCMHECYTQVKIASYQKDSSEKETHLSMAGLPTNKIASMTDAGTHVNVNAVAKADQVATPVKMVIKPKTIKVNPKVVARAKRYRKTIRIYAKHFKVDPALVEAVAHVESKFNPKAKSHVGAIGLMQLMPKTAKAFGATNAHIPWQNLRSGTKYLAWLMKHFGGDKRLAIAAYNAGPTAVKRYGDIPPYKETQNYVRRVMAAYAVYKNQTKEGSS